MCLGKYQPGIDRPDPKTWKANFRCAMNSLPDIEEVKDKSIKKGTNAFRVYKMLSSSERSLKKGELGAVNNFSRSNLENIYCNKTLVRYIVAFKSVSERFVLLSVCWFRKEEDRQGGEAQGK